MIAMPRLTPCSAVPPAASLRAVLRQMADHKWGTTVVVDEGRPVGIVTTTDALRLCVELLDQPR